MQVKLYSLLRMKYQGYDSEKGITVECKEQMSVKDVFRHLGIDEREVGMVVLGQKMVRSLEMEVHEHDVIHLFPPLPGGG